MSRSGRRVLGASSLEDDPERARYSRFAKLPWVLDPEFDSALRALIREQAVDEIFSPHPVVWERMATIVPSLSEKVYLHPQDWEADFTAYGRYFETARLLNSDSPEVALPVALAAGLVRLFELTPGQCSHTKLAALLSVFPKLPKGDLVEVGTLFGRSALALAFLAKYYDVGPLLCADPWSSEHLFQGSDAVDHHSSKVPIEAVFQAFLANLAPWRGTVNYLRLPSVSAAEQYGREASVESLEFGVTRYSRQISLLHLDGNHAYPAIHNDIQVWTPYVQSGGWIIFDDYRWPFGDGPRRAADEFCERHRDAWNNTFEAGGALFVGLSEPVGRK